MLYVCDMKLEITSRLGTSLELSFVPGNVRATWGVAPGGELRMPKNMPASVKTKISR